MNIEFIMFLIFVAIVIVLPDPFKLIFIAGFGFSSFYNSPNKFSR